MALMVLQSAARIAMLLQLGLTDARLAPHSKLDAGLLPALAQLQFQVNATKQLVVHVVGLRLRILTAFYLIDDSWTTLDAVQQPTVGHFSRRNRAADRRFTFPIYNGVQTKTEN